MNIRRQPSFITIGEEFIVDPIDSLDLIGAEPEFEPVGRPWRYEFPHQPSSSDPNAQPDFTVPVPGSESTTCLGHRLVFQTGTQE